jgi:hypothetical protein
MPMSRSVKISTQNRVEILTGWLTAHIAASGDWRASGVADRVEKRRAWRQSRRLVLQLLF